MSVKSNVLAVVKSLESESAFCEMCDAIHEDTEAGECSCGEELRPMSGFDWLTDALDIEWILNNDRTIKGARILVAFGGPNIWVNTTDNTVEGHWWGSSHIERFDDCIGLADAVDELFNC
jgi:hypothetical protein